MREIIESIQARVDAGMGAVLTLEESRTLLSFLSRFVHDQDEIAEQVTDSETPTVIVEPTEDLTSLTSGETATLRSFGSEPVFPEDFEGQEY